MNNCIVLPYLQVFMRLSNGSKRKKNNNKRLICRQHAQTRHEIQMNII